jgi:elongation factor Tu
MLVATMTRRPADAEGIFSLLTNGRSLPVSSGYRPQHQVHENYLSSGQHEYLDRALVAPGESARVEISFISPEV